MRCPPLNAAGDAHQRFNLERRVQAYLSWYLIRIESEEKRWARQGRNLKSMEPRAKP
jgi:hypothetical protein